MKTCETNYAELLGHIMTPPVYSHSVYEEKFYQMKFGVPRLSGHVDVLPAVVSASLLSCFPENAPQIGLKGQLRSYNQAEGKTNHLHIRFFAQSLQDELDALCPKRQKCGSVRGVFVQRASLSRHTFRPRNCGYAARGKPVVS